jgi:hypothetical protein
MKLLTHVCRLAAVAAAALLAACTSPTTPAVSFSAPGVVGPLPGASLKFSDQPITLTLANAVETNPATMTYSVDVATDSAFANKVVSRTGIVPSAGSTTSVALPMLTGNQTYYWRALTVVGSASSTAVAAKSFYVGPNVTLAPPVIESPSGVVSSATPTFTVADVTRTGTPGGTIFYDFQVASDSGFTNIIADSGQVSEQPTQTSWTSTVSLSSTNYSLRVQALDPADSVSTPFATTSFQVQPFDYTKAIMLANPGNFMVSWAQTANITSVDFEPDYFYVDFDKRTSPDRWPDVPFGTGTLQYTLGLCLNLYGQGQWYCSAAIQYWFGRDNGASENIGGDWYYDPARWGPMAGYQPGNGEIVGIFVGAGNLRDVVDGSGSYVLERSNVLLMPFGGQFSLTSGLKRAIKGLKLLTPPPGVRSSGIRSGGGGR